MDERPPLQRTTVDKLHETDLPRGAVVAAGTPLADLVETLDVKADLLAVYVVDPRDRYVGLVTRADVVGWIDHNLDPGSVHASVDGRALADGIAGATARDAVHPKSAEVPVEPTEPAAHALQRMLAHGLPVAPVVESDGSVVGQLALTRVLRRLGD